MTETWTSCKLGDVVELFDYKRIPLSAIEREKRRGPYPYYGASGVIDYIDDYLLDGKYLLIAEDGENLNSRKTPIAFFANGKFWVNNHAHILRAIETIAEDSFIKAWFDQANISGYITGAAQPKLSQSNLMLIELALPPLPTQRRIASILSAYDDLIENNTRRIRLLEAIAQAIYREWFVNFRFPEHERVRIVETEAGRIPKGWEVAKLSDVCDISDGDWIETKDQGGFDYRLLQVSNIGVGQFIETGNYRYITQQTFEKLNCREVMPGEILVARMPSPIGRAWLVTKMPWRMITAVDVAIIRANQRIIDPYYCIQWLNSPETLQIVEKQASGTTRPRITRRELSSMVILIPNLNIQKQYCSYASDLYALQTFLRKQNSILCQTRDLLLPKLVSGEVEVSAIEVNP